MKYEYAKINGFENLRRSREGAWIEIEKAAAGSENAAGRSREGAWIEIGWIIFDCILNFSRSREGAWIEML